MIRTLSGIEGWSRIERGQMGNQLDRCLALLDGERRETVEKIVIRERDATASMFVFMCSLYHGDT